ncbi:MAG TPA: beta-galactosidase [Armatimonadota bacterium]|nr:beta-galactosidase [Armatimonadota bacterium]
MRQSQGRRAEASPKYDIVYSQDLVTPHVKWADPYAEGPIRAFVMSSVHEGRTVVELKQRLTLEARVMSIDPRWDVNKWCMDRYADFDPLPANDYSRSYSVLEPELACGERYDVLVMHSVIGWNDMPRKIRDLVRARVQRGEGLVLVHPQLGENEKDSDLWDLSPIVSVPPTRLTAEGAGLEQGYPDPPRQAVSRKAWKKAADHYIVDGVPFEALPYGPLRHYSYELGSGAEALAVGENGAPVVAVKKYGKGRVVGLAYHNYALFPELEVRRGQLNETFWEYLFSLLMRSVIWAARKEPKIRLAGVEVSGKRFEPGSVGEGAATIRVRNEGAAKSGKVDVTVRNELGEVEQEVTRTVRLGKGRRDVRVPLPKGGAAGGRHLVDVIVSAEGKKQDWGTGTYEVRRSARVRRVALEAEAVPVGGSITGRACLSGDGRGLALVAELWDLSGRLLSRQEKTVGRGREVGFRLTCPEALTNYGWVRCVLREGGRTVHEARAEVALTAPRRTWQDYEVIVPWLHQGVWPWTDLVERQYREAGITSTSDTQWNFPLTVSMHPPGFGVYWYRRFPYLERKDNYRKTREVKWLARVPCIHTDEFRKPVARALRRGIPPILKYSPLAYYIADESAITCYEDALDLCWSKATLAEFRKWLRRWYGSLGRLNAEWDTRYRSWAKVMPVTWEEAQKRGNPAPWVDHRLFMNKTLADAFRYASGVAQKVDPQGLVTISGTQLPGSHNGCDWSKIDRIVEYLQPYSVGGQDEMHRSFNPEMILTGFTGYAMSGIPLEYEIWHRFLHGHRGASIFWGYTMVDPDLTLNAQGRSLQKCFGRLRGEGLCRAIAGLRRQHDRIAIHFSMASGHTWWISDGKLKLKDMEYGRRTSRNFGRFIGSRVAWGQVLEDLGYQYNYVAYDAVEEGGLAEYRVLVLPGSIALSEEEVEQIKAFVARGGLLLADEMPGRTDVHGKRLAKASLAEVFAGERYGRGRGLLLGRWLDQYDSHRLGSFGEEARAQVRAALAKSRVRPRVEVSAGGQFPVAVERVSWSGGRIEALALLKEPAGRFGESSDGTSIYEAIEGMKRTERVRVRLPKEGHWYDLAAHRYLGVIDGLGVSLKEADPKLYAMLPYKVGGVSLSVTGGRAPGEAVRYEAKVRAGRARAVRHVLQVEVFGPDGEKRHLYSGNIEARAGVGKGSLRLALNDQKGRWRMVVRDVFSGETAEKRWRVR